MIRLIFRACVLVAAFAAARQTAVAARAAIDVRTREPYLGAIVVDADTGDVLFEDGADEVGYPASVVKLMDLLLLQERIEQGLLALDDRVTVTAQAARMGGSQVYLAEKEVFPVEDLLYALTIQSANDVAVALALHIAGTDSAFVELMNSRAADIGMQSTRFHSCHGLPPAEGDRPDISTARDLAALSRELLRHPDILKYTSTRERGFREGKFIMRTHNHLLKDVAGCDGLKTGYFRVGGFSIAATVKRGERRIIAVVLGSPTRNGRDAQARALIERGFLALRPLPPPVEPPPALTTEVSPEAGSPPSAPVVRKRGGLKRLGRLALWIMGAVALVGVGFAIGRNQPRSSL